MSKACFFVLFSLLVFGLSGFAEEPEWDIEVGLDDSIYPSLIIATSTMSMDDEDQDPTNLGDPWGLTGVNIANPAPNTRVRVEISSGKLIRPSVWEGVMEKKGETYLICPILKYDYDTLLSVRQPFPEVVTARVTLDGKELPEKSKRVPVRSVNDCVLGFVDDDDWSDTSWLIAAYVNENHPFVDAVLREALDAGSVDSFAGYQKEHPDVRREIKAVYDALKRRGFRYSNITRASGESPSVGSQHIRLIGDQIRSSQANCVEGSVLMASIFRKLEMDPFLVLVPGHMFVGVYLDEDHEKQICIETTMLGDAGFDEAVREGDRQFREGADNFEDEDEPGYAVIDVDAARQLGVMPIRESQAEVQPLPARPAGAPLAPPALPKPAAKPAPPASGLETVAVKKMGVSIDLPPGWETELSEDGAGDPLFMAAAGDGELIVIIGLLGGDEDADLREFFRQYLEGAEMKAQGPAEDVELGGRAALLGHASGRMEGEPVRAKVLLVAGQGTVYAVQALGASKDYASGEELLDRIVKSFRVRQGR